MSKKNQIKEVEEVVIMFSGDSGDGMQLTGTLFSEASAMFGNDISTFPDYPADIRAPQGSVGGVSGFQVHLGHSQVNTPGDQADVLVCMNPAALKANVNMVKPGGTIIVDEDSFDEKNIERAGYKKDPIKEEKLGGFNVIKAPITNLTKKAVSDLELDNKSILRSKNMFALGIVYWIFHRNLDATKEAFENKFAKNPLLVESNKRVLQAGYNYGISKELLPSYIVNPAAVEKGTYRNMNGNIATAWGLLAAAENAGLELYLGSYPITPATEILQELSARRDLGAKVFQAEDEIAGICTALGASFAGNLGVTTTSGPGLALKSEAIGLAVMTELPLVIVNVQRGGPSTGLPTKTEQSDLFQALYGRNGESPAVVIAASTPSNCFHYAYQAAKIAVEHMTPVILLTDGYLANGSQPWRIPAMKDLAPIKPPFAPKDKNYKAYQRDAEKQVRSWSIPGTPGQEHRVGGLEKDAKTGNLSHLPDNHQYMTEMRAKKVDKVQGYIPDLKLVGEPEADLLVIGWGGTYGHLLTAVNQLQEEGKSISLALFNYINPLPKNTKDFLGSYKKRVVCELNLGQFANYLRMKFPQHEYMQFNKVQGLPFTISELKDELNRILDSIK